MRAGNSVDATALAHEKAEPLKRITFIIVLISLIPLHGQARSKATYGTAITNQIVEASCGQCRFHLPGKGCDLAVRIDDKAYFVDGTGIDDHGDAHAEDGLCARIRKARVSGQIVNNRFQATSFQLLPLDQISNSIHKGPHP